MDNWKLIYINILLIVVYPIIRSPMTPVLSSPAFSYYVYLVRLLNSKSHLLTVALVLKLVF